MKISSKIILVALFVTHLSLLQAADYTNANNSALYNIAKSYLSSALNKETAQPVAKPTFWGKQALEKQVQQKTVENNQFSTINSLLASTPDSVKAAFLNKIPNEYKGYLVQFIEFIKSIFGADKEKTATLDSLKTLLQQNIAESNQSYNPAIPAQ